MIYCGKAEFGQIYRSFASNSGAILLKRPINLTQIGFPSLRSVKPDRLLATHKKKAGMEAGLKAGTENRSGDLSSFKVTRCPADFFHHPGFVCEKVASGPHPVADHAIPTSLAAPQSL